MENSDLSDRITHYEEEGRHWIPARRGNRPGMTQPEDFVNDISDSLEELETDSAPIIGADVQTSAVPEIDRRVIFLSITLHPASDLPNNHVININT